MLVEKTGMRDSGPPAPQFYANKNDGAYATQYSPSAPDASAAKSRLDHTTAEERAAVDMAGDSGPAPSPYRGIAPRHTLERQEQDLENLAATSQDQLGDMLAEHQVEVPEVPWQDPLNEQEARVKADYGKGELDGPTGRGGPFPDLPTSEEMAGGVGAAARGGRPRVESRDMTDEELADLPNAAPPKKPARPVSMREVLDARAEETNEADKRRGRGPLAPQQQAAKPVNAGPEVLKPGPGEELQEGRPAAAQARAKPVPVPANNELRERYLDTIWPQISTHAEAHGMGENELRDIYDAAAQGPGGHSAGIQAMKKAIQGVRRQAVAAKVQENRQQYAEDANARRHGFHPQVYRVYRSMENATPDQRIAMLVTMHQQNPGMGYGNLAAMEMKAQADARQAGVLANNQQQLPAEKEQRNLAGVVGQGAGPGLIPSLRNHYRSTPEGQANPGGVDKFVADQATGIYKPLHGQRDLNPSQQVFVQQYVRMFPNFQAFRTQAGLEDTPENREWYTRVTGKPAATVGERLWNGVTGIGEVASDGVQDAWNYMFPRKPDNNAVADNGKKKERRPFDK
jgi:hypothetical protein